jgi:hypothetical protein
MGKTNSKKITSNAKSEEVQTRKLISAYGGVGSIVETRSGSIIIRPFNEWDFFTNKNTKRIEIEDPRLIKRLKEWFPKLEKLVKLPHDKNNFVNAEYFPKWMFSPATRRFAPLDEWTRRWDNLVKAENDKENILPPKCIDTYLNHTNNEKEKKKKSLRRFVELEQVRFIMISSSGKIFDIPWDRWVFSNKDTIQQNLEDDDSYINENEKGNFLDWNVSIPNNIHFEYTTSDKFSDLRGISIVARENGTNNVVKRRTLAGLFNLKVTEYELKKAGLIKNYEKDSIVKVVIRSSNSVYYPNIISSLYLPPVKIQELLFSSEEIELIKDRVAKGRSIEVISDALEDKYNVKRTPLEIQKLISNNYQQESVILLEEAYRLGEYLFITQKDKRYADNDQLVFEPIDTSIKGIRKVYAMERLKLTSVQPSYTRQEPIDKDSFLTEDTNEERDKVPVKKMYTHGWRKESVKYFPAVESYGEGVFIDFDSTAIDNWLSEFGHTINNRVNHIQHNFDNHKRANQERIITPQLVMIHTFCHLIMKELEFLCGYPASSLQERLYIGNEMQGILIYTIAGSEGSYGGLVSLANSNKIDKIILSALARAQDCASDPICYHTGHEGQGAGGTNLAACFSCALLPETSCEEFNSFLDRRLVIDTDYGYFKL